MVLERLLYCRSTLGAPRGGRRLTLCPPAPRVPCSPHSAPIGSATAFLPASGGPLHTTRHPCRAPSSLVTCSPSFPKPSPFYPVTSSQVQSLLSSSALVTPLDGWQKHQSWMHLLPVARQPGSPEQPEFTSNSGVASATPPGPHCILSTLICDCPPLPRTCLGMGSRTPAPTLRPSPAHTACLRVPPAPPRLSPRCSLALIGSCSALILFFFFFY